MGNSVTRTDFEWVKEDEPHAKRRIDILSKFLSIDIILQLIIFSVQIYISTDLFLIPEKYPQIKKLFGVDPMFKWKVCFLMLIQFVMLFVIQHQSWIIVILSGYMFGGVINHALMLGRFVFIL